MMLHPSKSSVLQDEYPYLRYSLLWEEPSFRIHLLLSYLSPTNSGVTFSGPSLSLHITGVNPLFLTHNSIVLHPHLEN